MSWYLFDADGYLGDFASINGLQQLSEYAENVAGLRSFLDNGWAMQADLKNALENAPKPSNVAVDATLVNLKKLVENADEIVIISDGFEPDTEVEKGLDYDDKSGNPYRDHSTGQYTTGGGGSSPKKNTGYSNIVTVGTVSPKVGESIKKEIDDAPDSVKKLLKGAPISEIRASYGLQADPKWMALGLKPSGTATAMYDSDTKIIYLGLRYQSTSHGQNSLWHEIGHHLGFSKKAKETAELIGFKGKNYEGEQFAPAFYKWIKQNHKSMMITSWVWKSLDNKADAGTLLWHLDLSAWNDNFEDEFTAEFEEIIQKNGEHTLNRLPVAGLTFRQDYPQVEAYLSGYKAHLSQKLWPDFNDETAKQLSSALSEGYAAGESIPKLSKRVAEVFDVAKGYRTTRIARTEVIRASNYGAEAGYIQSGVVQYKEWLTAKDERLCPWCNSMNGKRVGVAETFVAKNDWVLILDPKDESGRTVLDALKNTYGDIKAPPLHPNCRCTLVPVVKALEPVAILPDKDTLLLGHSVVLLPQQEAINALIAETAKECKDKVYFNDMHGNKLRNSDVMVNNVLPKFTARLKSILGGVDETLSVGSSKTTFTSFAASGHTADDLYKMLQISSKGMVYGAHCGPTTAINSTAPFASHAIANGKKMMENMLDTLGKFTCDEVKMKLNMLKAQLRIHPEEFIRAYYQVGDIHLGWDYGTTPTTQKRTLFHEFGHHVEDATNSAKDMDSWRFKRGVESEKDIKYKYLYGGTEEKAVVDKFWDDYIGKVYARGSTEVFSMGLQCFRSPQALVTLMEEDFEHFALIYGRLIGAFI
jgi:SPP1 gp7 family putative phage head morphogenesis protein